MADTRSIEVPRRIAPVSLIGLFGILILPMTIVLLTNSWDAPTPPDFVRMAFGTVAASTLAMATAFSIMIANNLRGSSNFIAGGVAFVVIGSGITSIVAAADRLVGLIG
ncbi:MAG: hypothetical protein LH624_00740 [Cryobacterium sp.]|nr:hypothetical protein [Cryobacterium sp.]